MKSLVTGVAIVLATACTTVKATEGPAGMRILAGGTQTVAETVEPVTVLASDEATYRAQWSSLIGAGEVPPVDFETEVAVILLAGERNTGGYRVAAESARVEGDELIVRARIHSPAARSIVSDVITSPYVVVAVKARGVTSLRWEK
jgi:hypothetical protein